MRRLLAFLVLCALPQATFADVYLVNLEAFRKWPAPAQQGYLLGAVDQALTAAYYYDPKLYEVTVECVESAGTEALLGFVLRSVLAYEYDEPVIDLVGDGVAEFCMQKGFEWPEG